MAEVDAERIFAGEEEGRTRRTPVAEGPLLASWMMSSSPESLWRADVQLIRSAYESYTAQHTHVRTRGVCDRVQPVEEVQCRCSM